MPGAIKRPLTRRCAAASQNYKFNRCPAVAPLGVLKGAEQRLQLDTDTITKTLRS